eukprot:TRINITY_DN2743_c5_g1_i1.p1 TRINITY_DN2743_c5_g1~~TRINITY_DN2743_c5_g1_i1.p1  ORF type:complete len:338 (+),score=92.92 TRINITY_DN2743_c5_g1_i1:54-1016(+)
MKISASAITMALLSSATGMTVVGNTTIGYGSSVAANGGKVYTAGAAITDGTGSLEVLEIRSGIATKVSSTGICVTPVSGISGVVADDDHIFVACPTALEAMSTEDIPRKEASYLAAMHFSLSISQKSNIIFAGTSEGINLLRLSTDETLSENDKIRKLSSLPGVSGDVFCAGGSNVAVTAGSKDVSIFDVSDVSAPKKLSSVAVPQLFAGNSASLSEDEKTVVFGGAGMCFGTIDISNPSSPTLEGTIPGGNGLSVAVKGNIAYAACSGEGPKLHKIDISDPKSPKILASLSFTNIIESLALADDFVLITTSNQLIVISP